MKLPAFALLASAAVLPAEAAVVYSDVQNVTIPFTFGGVYLNIATGANSTGDPGNTTTSPTINFFFGGTAISTEGLLAPVADGSGNVLSLTAGSPIDGSLTYAGSPNGSADHVGAGPGQFDPNVAGYMGFSFRITGSEPDPYYGWLRFTPSNSGGAVIESWAYENAAGQGIQAGAIPEPSAALLLLGAGLLPLARRRR